jgi:hypothetical protein
VKRALVGGALGAVALALVLTGCQTPSAAPAASGPQTTTAQAGPAAVQWADNLCAAILDYDSTAPKPEIDSTSPAAMIASLTSYLDATLTRVNGLTSKLSSLGAAPVSGGDEAAQNIVSALSDMRAVVDRSKGKLANVDTNDRTGTSATLQDIARDLQTLRVPVNPLEGMGARYPDLQAAVRSADNCTEISRTRASRSALPPLTTDSSTESSTPTSTEPSVPTSATTTTTTTTPS